jgi:Uroporphyrinogen decarboxylase (URO-D)
MQNSFKLVEAFINGHKIWRIPMYDLLRNDAVTSYFGGEPVTLENGRRVVFSSYEPAVDSTRPLVRTPNEEKTVKIEDGREQRYFRWTIWTSNVHYKNEETYKIEKEKLVNNFIYWDFEKQKALELQLSQHNDEQKELGDIYYFPVGPCNWLTRIYDEVGLEDFTLYWAYYPELIDQILACHAQETIAWAEHLPVDFKYNAVFLADDIAFNKGPLMPVDWFIKSYIPLLEKICHAFHKKNIKVLFHSDGDLYPILDEMVAAGIDGLNPIEIMAGMDVGVIHRKYPKIFMAGGIDVSQLLPFARPQEIRDVVKKAIDDAEGRIMIGSSTEVHNEVPLENYLALREAVLGYKL